MDDFYSYQSRRQVIAAVGDSVVFIGDISGLSRGFVNYEHLSEKGTLGLIFFEDKLAAVGFYPKDSASYMQKIANQFGVGDDQWPIICDGAKIQKGYDYELGSVGGFFISWSDPKLIEKYKDRVW